MKSKKNDQKVSKKTEKKQQDKVIEDKTFGLKNKNKSTKVQKFIKGVQVQVKQGNVKGGMEAQKTKEYQEKEGRKRDEEKNALLASLFKSATSINKGEQGGEGGKDPKTMVCAFFKAGVCKKGKKCKFSHDLSLEKQTAKIDIYVDKRREETMESWDQEYLETVVKEKNKRRGQIPSNITCKYFLEALEKEIYGWRWECPNGETCQYRHALPAGFVLKKKGHDPSDDIYNQGPTFEELIEDRRAALPTEGLTPLTKEVFEAWKDRKAKQKMDKIEEERKEEAIKTGGKGHNILTGRALFVYDPGAFEDDEGAEEEYPEEEYPEGEEYLEESKEKAEIISSAPLYVPHAAQAGEGENNIKEEEIKVDQDLFLQENLDDLDL